MASTKGGIIAIVAIYLIVYGAALITASIGLAVLPGVLLVTAASGGVKYIVEIIAAIILLVGVVQKKRDLSMLWVYYRFYCFACFCCSASLAVILLILGISVFGIFTNGVSGRSAKYRSSDYPYEHYEDQSVRPQTATFDDILLALMIFTILDFLLAGPVGLCLAFCVRQYLREAQQEEQRNRYQQGGFEGGVQYSNFGGPSYGQWQQQQFAVSNTYPGAYGGYGQPAYCAAQGNCYAAGQPQPV